jgi:ATP-binding cassette, subfamily B (MDR/TAP), member 6
MTRWTEVSAELVALCSNEVTDGDVVAQGWIAVVVLATVASYIPLTIAVTERRGKVRKQMNKLDNDKEQRATDMLLCVETVKCFGMEPLELALYGEAVDKFQVCS